MLERIKNYIAEYEIIKPQDRIIAGVSGGADSVCLFLVLNELKDQIGFELEVIHVEHGIRGEDSRLDADFTEKLCFEHDVLCNTVNLDVPSYATENGYGLEEAARLLRYKVFEKRAEETGGKIALAHHQEDNAETVVFQMIRGSGIHGVTGMKPVRRDENGITYIRPLLCVSRGEIEAFLDLRNQSFCVDGSNFDTKYDRNRIRHNVLPELEKINDKASMHINATAQKLSVIEDYIRLQVEKAVGNMLSISEDKYYIDVDGINSLHPAVKSECILEILGIAAGRKKDIGAVHVNSLLELMNLQSGKKIMLPYNLEAVREFDRIVLSKAAVCETEKEIFQVDSNGLLRCLEKGESLKIQTGNAGEGFELRAFDFDGDFDKIPQKAYTKWVDYDKIKDGFLIRKRQDGDFFVNDSSGHRKKIKSFFIDEKIPLSERNKIWLMANGQEIIIIPGYRINEAFKVTKETRRILEVIFTGRK